MAEDPSFRCENCGTTFHLPAATLARYPNWTPRRCMNCRENGVQSRGQRNGNGSGAARATRTDTTGLSPAAVAERFSGGPQDGVFTDGSCQGNPGPGGWGAVWVRSGEIVDEAYGYEPSTTNNRMELTAMIAGLRMLPQDARIDVYTDSRLVVETLTKWAASWEARGWKRREGEVKNLELVQEAYRLAKERPDVSIRWIRAHDGSRWNEYADALSTAHLRAGS